MRKTACVFKQELKSLKTKKVWKKINANQMDIFYSDLTITFEYFLFQLMPKTKKSFLHNWEPLEGDLMRETQSGRMAEKNIVTLDPIYDPKNEEFIYNYRRDTKAPLVAAYGSELLIAEKAPKGEKKDKKDKKKKDPYSHMVVLTERMPHRLADAPQLTYPETLYVLDRSLEGYETAYDKCGPMRVNDRMIGFNP